MVVRFPVWFKFFVGVLVFGGSYAACQELGGGGFKPWFALLVGFPLGIVGIFIVFTFRLRVSAEGVASGWHIGFGPYRLWESNRSFLSWKNVTRLRQQEPAFLPPTLVGVVGKGEDDEEVGHNLPAFGADWYEAIAYMAEHIDPSVIDENMKLIRKSRKRVGQETTPQAEEAGR